MMRVKKYEISEESLKSRIPGLFPYLFFNELGECSLHAATDSSNGCYNKIVENMIVPEGAGLTVDDTTVIIEGEEYSYRTLIDTYYIYREEMSEDDGFREFIERGIGRVKVTDEDWYNSEEHDLVPEYIYMALARTEYRWFLKRKALCEQYEKMLEEGTHTDCQSDYCCKCEEYERKGGDNMMSLLYELITDADTRAEEYLSYAQGISENGLTINLPILLTETIKDNGILTIEDMEWEAGEEYNIGDVVVYENETYICTGTTTGYFDEDKETILFDEDNFAKIKDNTAYSDNLIDSSDSYAYKFKITDEDGSVSDEDIELTGHTDSKLRGLRTYKDYINIADEMETPASGEDWLYYYRVGYVTNLRSLNDDMGNIEHYNDGEGDDGTTLYAYGDVITAITAEAVEGYDNLYALNFEYVIGAHLTATSQGSKTDDDGNVMYLFSDFVYDEDDTYHGVKYNETYYVDTDSDIYNDLIATGEFEDYVTTMDNIDKTKYEFSTTSNTEILNKIVEDTSVKVPVIMSDYTVTVENAPDYQYPFLHKTDYLSGITHQPIKSIDVKISRGNAAAMERHIKLGEVKTMEDMENYANGGFFNVQNVDA